MDEDARSNGDEDPGSVEVEVAIRLVGAHRTPTIVVAGLLHAGAVAAQLAEAARRAAVELEVLDLDQPSGAIRVTHCR